VSLFDRFIKLRRDSSNGGPKVHAEPQAIDGGDVKYQHVNQLADADGQRVPIGALLREQNELLYMILSELRVRNGKPPLPGDFPL